MDLPTAHIRLASSRSIGFRQLTPLTLVILESKPITSVTQETFADGQAIATKALNGDPIPFPTLKPKLLAAGSATSLYAILAPELGCKLQDPLNPVPTFSDLSL